MATYGRDAKNLLKGLQSQNERMFLLTFLVFNTGRTPQELETNVFQAASIAQKHNCQLVRLDWQQEQGLMSSLPLAHNLVETERALTTSSTAIFIPFTTQELFQAGPGALYYGLNALSNNLIMVDRKRLKNPNGLILGTPGSGKSFAAKREITNAFLATDDDIIVCDPEAEYAALVERLHGQVIKISPTSTQFINPMDINANYSEEDNPIALKSDFILSLCELVVGGKEGLLPVEKTVIDRCVHQIYQAYFQDPRPEKMPLLEDLYKALLEQEEKEAHHVATALEIYVKGSLNLFNHRTNVDIDNRFVCYDIRELGKQLKKIGMLVVQDAVWGRVTTNRYAGKTTRFFIDEFHLLLREERTAAYSVEIWKRFRKWGGAPTGITQNVKDLLASHEVSNIFENSDFTLMLNQAASDLQILAKQLKKIVMLVVQDAVWGRVTTNRYAGKTTRFFIDEFHLLLREEQTAAYSVEIWKRFRKWGGAPTGITQNVKDLLASHEVSNIFENSDFILMLNQAACDRQILAKQLNISPHQLSYVTHSGEGEGLLFYGNVILPFVDRFPQDTELYRIMTTKFSDGTGDAG